MREFTSLGISPAPWTVRHTCYETIEGYERRAYITAQFVKGQGVQCVVDEGIYKDADAYLMGASPELREALCGLLEIVCDDCKSWYGESREKCKGCPRVKAARNALAKASGEGEEEQE